jgi:hypothetical protein
MVASLLFELVERAVLRRVDGRLLRDAHPAANGRIDVEVVDFDRAGDATAALGGD